MKMKEIGPGSALLAPLGSANDPGSQIANGIKTSWCAGGKAEIFTDQ